MRRLRSVARREEREAVWRRSGGSDGIGEVSMVGGSGVDWGLPGI